MRYVYFIRPIGMQGPVKIGCSNSPNHRVSTLETWSPFPLEIIAKIEGSPELERRFHAKFRAYHERREWFTWSQDIEDTIAAINAGSFDTSTLPEPANITCGSRERSAEQRLGLSYSLRVARLRERSGYDFPGNITGMVKRGDTELIGRVEEYLAAPHVHGRPMQAPWAEHRRKEWGEFL